MKTKNMRKKALVSSLAMLLVAVVALSGATYAWFTSNTAATATGMDLKAAQDSSLQFAKPESALPTDKIGQGLQWADNAAYYADESNWAGTYTLSATQKTLTPRSANVDATATSGLTSFIAVNSVAANPNPAKTGEQYFLATSFATPQDPTGSEGYYTESFYVKSTGATYLYLTGLSATGTSGTALRDCLRFAVKVTDVTGDTNNAQIFTINGPSGSTVRKCVTAATTYDQDNDGDVTFKELYQGKMEDNTDLPDSITVVPQTISTVGANGGSTTDKIPLCKLAGGDATNKRLVTITVWLEGNDARCVNSVMGVQLADISLTFGISATGAASSQP